jgi:hypothetical protein
VDVAVLAVEPDAVLLFVRLVTPVEDGVTEEEAVLVVLELAELVMVMAAVEERSGDTLTDDVCVDVLEARGEYDCVAEPVVVLDIELELVIVLLEIIVNDVRGVTLQHAELLVVSVTDTDSQPLAVELLAAVGVNLLVPAADTVKAALVDAVAVPRRVGRAVIEAEPETVAVLGAKTEFVPVTELVVVFDTLMLRV